MWVGIFAVMQTNLLGDFYFYIDRQRQFGLTVFVIIKHFAVYGGWPFLW